MAKRDYYEVLGIDRNADASAIKSAYRKLAMKHHPDKNPGDAKSEALFKDATEAYEILKDDEKRAAYDQFGHSAFEGGSGSQGQGSGFGGFGSAGTPCIGWGRRTTRSSRRGGRKMDGPDLFLWSG